MCVICIMYIYICAYQLVQRISSINRIAGFLNQKNGKKTSPKPEFFVQGITGFTRFTALLHLFLYVWSTYPPLTYHPLRNKDIIASLKGNRWLISPDHKALFFWGEVRGWRGCKTSDPYYHYAPTKHAPVSKLLLISKKSYSTPP